MTEDFRHRVAADIGVLEHEGVARMIAEGLNAADQLVIDHARIAVLQLAHALVEQGDEILDAVGHRRIGGEADVARVAALGQHPLIGAGAVLQIGRLGQRDDFGEDLDFLVDARTAAEEGVDRLLEIEQPERQPQISRVEHQRLVAEAVAVFVVRIDQEEAQVRPRIENLLQDDGDAARFADAGGAENGEVAADQLVDVDVHADIGILLQVADMGVVVIGAAIDQAQFAFAQDHGDVADARIVGDAALETRRAGAVGLDLADQIEPRNLAHGRVAGGPVERLFADLGDQADDDGLAAHQAHVFPDGGTLADDGPRVKFDAGLRTGHDRNAADQFGA